MEICRTKWSRSIHSSLLRNSAATVIGSLDSFENPDLVLSDSGPSPFEFDWHSFGMVGMISTLCDRFKSVYCSPVSFQSRAYRGHAIRKLNIVGCGICPSHAWETILRVAGLGRLQGDDEERDGLEMISVVCVYNNKQVLREYLESSLDVQTSGLEKILVDNSQNKYESAAKALNEGATRANGRYVLFIHQDVRLYPETWLADAEKLLDSLQNVGIAGLAGKKASEGVMSNIIHGIPPRPAGNTRIDRVETAQTVDECAMIVPKSVFDVLRFDEEVCDSWHLYGVDYSLSVRNLGLEVFVLPLEAHHISLAYSMSGSYYKSLKKVLRKHRKEYEYVYTTMGDWRTAVPVSLSRLLKRTHVLR